MNRKQRRVRERQGRAPDAAPAVAPVSADRRLAICRAPQTLASYNALGLSLAVGAQPEPAAACFARVLRLSPDHPDALQNLATVRRDQGMPTEAAGLYRRALARSPSDPRIHGNLGLALAALEDWAGAALSHRRALCLHPGLAPLQVNLGGALRRLGQPQAALRCFARATRLEPDRPESWYNLATAWTDLGASPRAVAFYRLALALMPDHADAHGNLGLAWKHVGNIEAAIAATQRALHLQAKSGYFFNLAELVTFAAGDPALAAMRRAIGCASLTREDRINLNFALGKAYDDCREPARAFAHYHEGNALKRRSLGYDEAATVTMMRRIAQQFDESLRDVFRAAGNPSVEPIFLIGMPRSGSTLVEQILASHSDVFGGDERGDFAALVGQSAPAAQPYPDFVPALTADRLQRLGSDYVAALRRIAPGAKRVTDKMPMNFLYAGLIHLALPHARIIHTRRDPIDTCLSCFTKLFSEDQPYCYDLGELGRYWRAYDRLMAHWRAWLPADRFIEVEYETLVADLEGQTRRLLDHCGLAWQPSCLDFHRTPRQVRTASAVQVRQQLHRRSVGRWRAYQAYLTPLLDALGLDADALSG